MERKKPAETLTRLTETRSGSEPQLVIPSVQKARPAASGSRLRKSRYCWRTNFCASSTGLGRAESGAGAKASAAEGGEAAEAAAKLEGLSTDRKSKRRNPRHVS